MRRRGQSVNLGRGLGSDPEPLEKGGAEVGANPFVEIAERTRSGARDRHARGLDDAKSLAQCELTVALEDVARHVEHEPPSRVGEVLEPRIGTGPCVPLHHR